MDLGDPLDLKGGEMDVVYNEIWLSQSDVDCHVIFTWDMIKEGVPHRGSTKGPITETTMPIILVKAPARTDPLQWHPKDLTDSALVLVHELGHWITTQFLETADLCAGGEEHFSHDLCSNGDTRAYLNLMAAGSTSRLISTAQADIYNRYADQIQPQ